MSEEQITPTLADIVRDWIRQDVTLNEHFFVHKLEDQIQIRMSCDGMRVMAGVNYVDEDEFKDQWYIGVNIVHLNPARPDFFAILEKYLRQEHNRFQRSSNKSDCSIVL